MNSSNAYLILTDKITESVINSYFEISKATNNNENVYILYHYKGAFIPTEIEGLKYFAFTNSVLEKLNYTPISFNLIPGSNHFPLLQFFLQHGNYKNYWLIEDDVRFSGGWKYFFDSFLSLNHDFISCHFRKHKDEPDWHWWPSLVHPYTHIPLKHRIRSFNPIYRISAEALTYIHRALLGFWSGHHEVLLPTLIYLGGFELLNLSGTGMFSVPNIRFCTSNASENGFLSSGTMRFRPVFNEIGEEKNMLYHPVKNLTAH